MKDIELVAFLRPDVTTMEPYTSILPFEVLSDELGYVPASKAGAELLFDLIGSAYERQSLIVTTNLPFEQWTEVMGSERLTGALLDRLTHKAHILEFTGESYRFRQRMQREAQDDGYD